MYFNKPKNNIMKKKIKVTGTMADHFASQKFHLAGEAVRKLSEMRHYFKNNKIPYTYKAGQYLDIDGGRAEIC